MPLLGKTAGGLYWMFRYLERSENTARLVGAGLRIALTRWSSGADEWSSIVSTVGARDEFLARHRGFDSTFVVDFMLRDRSHPSSVISLVEAARNNARVVRTALTREVWEAVNETWMSLKDVLDSPIRPRDLPMILGQIRRQSAYVRGAMHGTMLRNDLFDFARTGTFLERADNTARILDVKYYVLLPSVVHVGAPIDNVQWETILRSVSAEHAYEWLNEGDPDPSRIAHFLILDRRMPRSMAFCCDKILDNLRHLEADYGTRMPSLDMAEGISAQLSNRDIGEILEDGLHPFIQTLISRMNALGCQIEKDYRFTA
ncbi:MAG: alpha-E domain-containing protein [Paracoccaceae bacterium]|nr:alpha-E domain-containing protein [Paracoccaceae bacterium]MDE2912313.1 alpha-E domain-containing protein [Paracoccaceae bacterium]